jgi:biopolymer transport protein TolQ
MDRVIYTWLVSFQHAPSGGGRVPGTFELIAQATLPVKGVLAILLIFSVACWYIIGFKWLYLRRAFNENESFLKVFEETRQLNVANDAATQRPRSPVAALYRAGYDELIRVKAAAGQRRRRRHREHRARPAPRHLEADHHPREHGPLPRHHRAARRPSSASSARCTASCTPSSQLSASHDTSTIDRVGPGIAEALFTTAVGLVAAIPAVIAYNYFVRQIRVLSTEMDIFANDFLNIVRRHILK